MITMLVGIVAMSGIGKLAPVLGPVAAHAGFAPGPYHIWVEGLSAEYDFVNKDAKVTLRLMLGDFEDANGVADARRGLGMTAEGRELPKSPPCGPLGDVCYFRTSPRSLDTIGERFHVHAEFTRLEDGVDPKLNRVVEGIVRTALAELIGSDLNADGSQILPQDFSIEHPHWTYKPLSKLADAHSLTVSKGEWGDQCVVTSNGHNLTLTLGSLEAKVDGQSVELPAFPVSKNAVWIVPSTAVLSALGVHRGFFEPGHFGVIGVQPELKWTADGRRKRGVLAGPGDRTN